MLTAGSIEEKVFERQLSKEGLSGIATNEQAREEERGKKMHAHCRERGGKGWRGAG